jgi:hypothetical protein
VVAQTRYVEATPLAATNYKTGKLNGLMPLMGLKKGDKIYAARPITNRHRMATYLAVQDTMQEIE